MRIGVIGAGAVGGTIAALLEHRGHEVEVAARGRHLAAIREHGLTLSGAFGESVARLIANESLTETPDLAFVCTKAQDAASAINANAEHLGGIPVVIVQNGLSGLDEARALLPGSECIGGLALYAASFLHSGEVSVTAPGPTYLGQGTTISPAVRQCAIVLGAVMPTIATDNFAGTQWTKLVVNQVNAMPAITGMSAQETIANRRLRRLITASMRETIRIGLANNVHFGTLKSMNHRMLRTLAVTPLWFGQFAPRRMAASMGATPNPGSTLQSIRRGQRTEIDYLSGAVVAAAKDVGFSAPVNAMLVDLVHEVERTGRFLLPAEVVDRFRS